MGLFQRNELIRDGFHLHLSTLGVDRGDHGRGTGVDDALVLESLEVHSNTLIIRLKATYGATRTVKVERRHGILVINLDQHSAIRRCRPTATPERQNRLR